ncbi:MAG: helix-turn-helix domain-containing protein [Planctomycetes bacterium]|nr:helix-turn-helix domain-containing protein [Planctomycetota bacterium]
MERANTWEVPEEKEAGRAEREGPVTGRETAEQWRGQVDLLDLRAHLLDRQDRTLLQMYLEAGLSFHEIARWTGLSPSTVCRRIHRIIQRLSDPTYPICLRHPRYFRPKELDVIRDHFVRGLSLACLRRRRHVGHRRLRRIIVKARRMARALAVA